MSTRIELETLANTRDLGGMFVSDGRRIRKGRLIRSGQLVGISSSDKAILSSLVDTVVDFRTPEEIKDQPDDSMDGVKHISIPIVESFTAGVSREEQSDEELISNLAFRPEAAREYMRTMYRKFVTGFCTTRYSKFLKILLEDHEKAVLWHCSAGKDRAGIGAVIIEEILGVPRESIIADYNRTREFLSPYTEGYVSFVKSELGKLRKLSEEETAVVEESMRSLFGLEGSYLEAYYEEVRKQFGSYEAFIREGLGLSADQIQQLRDKYLE
ncbi:MAG: tyrosine-protein phosphatase [Spirochaetales bacterium]|nr:tyrosine-protein phosphatase [Spirochaetales bacterium]